MTLLNEGRHDLLPRAETIRTDGQSAREEFDLFSTNPTDLVFLQLWPFRLHPLTLELCK